VLQLIDMGFSREQAMEALLHTSGLEQATEYCLTHQQPAPAAASAQVRQPSLTVLSAVMQNLKCITLTVNPKWVYIISGYYSCDLFRFGFDSTAP